MIVDGLQTRGIFALRCTVTEATITAERLWVRDADQLGKVVSLVESNGEARFSVHIPETLTFPACSVELRRA